MRHRPRAIGRAACQQKSGPHLRHAGRAEVRGSLFRRRSPPTHRAADPRLHRLSQARAPSARAYRRRRPCLDELAAALDVEDSIPHMRVPADKEAALEAFSPYEAAAPTSAPQENDAAYFGFTSGSTGRPKGIVTTHLHRSLHFLDWHVKKHGFTPNDHFSMLSGLSHDPVLRDIFTPLSIGASLHIPDQTVIFDPYQQSRWLAEQAITEVHQTPAQGQIHLQLKRKTPRLSTSYGTSFSGRRAYAQSQACRAPSRRGGECQAGDLLRRDRDAAGHVVSRRRFGGSSGEPPDRQRHRGCAIVDRHRIRRVGQKRRTGRDSHPHAVPVPGLSQRSRSRRRPASSRTRLPRTRTIAVTKQAIWESICRTAASPSPGARIIKSKSEDFASSSTRWLPGSSNNPASPGR